MKKELRFYRTKEGIEPFINWLESLKDVIGRAQITNRLDRAAIGNYGDCKPIGGPGYRVYFSEQQDTILLLLVGGKKRTQDKDIKKSKKYWTEFRERHYD